MTPSRSGSERWSAVDGFVLAALAAAAMSRAPWVVVALSVALGLALVATRARGWARPAAAGVRAGPALRVAWVCVVLGVCAVGLVPMSWTDRGRTKGGHAETVESLLVQAIMETVRNSVRRDAAGPAAPAAAGRVVELRVAGRETGMYFALPRTAGGEARVVEMPRDAVDRDGAPHPDRALVFSADGPGAWLLASDPQTRLCELSFRVRRLEIEGIYEVTVCVYHTASDANVQRPVTEASFIVAE